MKKIITTFIMITAFILCLFLLLVFTARNYSNTEELTRDSHLKNDSEINFQFPNSY